MPSVAQLSALAIVVLILFSAAALYLMYEIGRLVGEKTTADKFPDAKKAAVRRSRSVLGGMFAEQLAPYLPNFPFSPTEAKFIGAPIDFLVFKGMDEQRIEEVIFVEVKSGAAHLNHNEHSLKDAIDNKRVRWHEYRVPIPLTQSADHTIEPTI
jgi:predicted Holliday junction resolvase-like endonuclease